MNTTSTSYLSLCLLVSFLIGAVPPPALAQNNLETTITKRGDTVRVRRDPQTGTARRVYGMSRNVRQYGMAPDRLHRDSIPALSQALVEEYADVLKIDPTALQLERAETDGTLWFVSYIQTVGGVPVHGTEIGYTIGKRGFIIALGADAYPTATPAAVPTTATVPQDRALEVAREAFAVDSARVMVPGKLVVLPGKGPNPTFRLVWEVRLFAIDPPKDITFFVGARSGRIVQKRSNLNEVHRPFKNVPPDPPHPLRRSGELLYPNRHGVSSLGGTISGQVTGDVYPEYPGDTPQSEGLSTSNIRVYNSVGQLVANVDANGNGNWSTGWLSTGTYQVVIPLQNSWVLPRRGDGVAGPDDPSGDTLEHSTYVSTNGGDVQYDYDWTTGDATGDETNVLHHATVIHDFFKGAPFSYGGMDYQMPAYTNQGSTVGAAGNGTTIIFGTRDGYQFARSSDAIYHEYAHNTVYSVYGDEFICNLSTCDDGYVDSDEELQMESMDEGLSDYFTGTLNNDAVIAENVGVNRNLDNNTYQFSLDCGGSSDCDPVHWNGQVIGGAAWDARQAIGATQGDRLVFKAMQITPQPRQYGDFGYNMKLADWQLYGTTDHWDEIDQAFGNHGISVPSPPPIVTITGPSSLNSGESGTWTADVSRAKGSLSYQWYEKYDADNTFSPISGATSASYSSAYYGNVTLKAEVTADNGSDADTHYVSVDCDRFCVKSTLAERLTRFEGEASRDGTAILTWTTPSSMEAPFEVQRTKESGDAAWTTVGTVEARSPAETYRFTVGTCRTQRIRFDTV